MAEDMKENAGSEGIADPLRGRETDTGKLNVMSDTQTRKTVKLKPISTRPMTAAPGTENDDKTTVLQPVKKMQNAPTIARPAVPLSGVKPPIVPLTPPKVVTPSGNAPVIKLGAPKIAPVAPSAPISVAPAPADAAPAPNTESKDGTPNNDNTVKMDKVVKLDELGAQKRIPINFANDSSKQTIKLGAPTVAPAVAKPTVKLTAPVAPAASAVSVAAPAPAPIKLGAPKVDPAKQTIKLGAPTSHAPAAPADPAKTTIKLDLPKTHGNAAPVSPSKQTIKLNLPKTPGTKPAAPAAVPAAAPAAAEAPKLVPPTPGAAQKLSLKPKAAPATPADPAAAAPVPPKKGKLSLKKEAPAQESAQEEPKGPPMARKQPVRKPGEKSASGNEGNGLYFAFAFLTLIAVGAAAYFAAAHFINLYGPSKQINFTVPTEVMSRFVKPNGASEVSSRAQIAAGGSEEAETEETESESETSSSEE